MTRGSLSPDTLTRPVRALTAAAVALAAVLVLATPVAAVGPAGLGQQTTEPSGPGGIGEAPGGGRQTTEPQSDRPETTERSTTTTTESQGTKPTTPSTTTGDSEQPTGRSVDGDEADDDDGDGTSIAALAGVGFLGLVLGAILAAVPLGAALARRKRPAPVTSPYAPGSPGAAAPLPPPPPGGPLVGPAPSREEAQARSQRAELAEALMGLRDQLPSAALSDEVVRALAAVGITEIRPDGQPFDPARHRAVHQVEVADPARHNTVVSTERPGYADGDRVVRLPEVVVARHGGAPS